MLCSDFWVKRVQMEGQYDSSDHGVVMGRKKKNMGICTDKQTAKEHVFMSHDVCECVILLAVRGERVWARRQQIHPPLGAQSEGR